MLIAHVLRDKGAQVHTARADVSLEEAARALDQKRVGALVVLNESGAIVGVVSERDIVREVSRRGSDCLCDAVKTVMSKDVVTALLNETIDEGLARMTDRRIRHLPVIEDGKLVGIVSIGDLVRSVITVQGEIIQHLQQYINGPYPG